ncbi:hypothetical protein LCGC14_2840220 [marine sediment metagenome]|uniref:DUF4177 domain-containing protein n=1 Tax=marine sediment metagenome TaxID=412755 RepID=A0A0F8YBK3_9ZZZZ
MPVPKFNYMVRATRLPDPTSDAQFKEEGYAAWTPKAMVDAGSDGWELIAVLEREGIAYEYYKQPKP